MIDERIDEMEEDQTLSKEEKKDANDADDNDGNMFRKRRKAFLDLLIHMSKEANFSRNDIQEEVDTFMFEACKTHIFEIPISRHVYVSSKRYQ